MGQGSRADLLALGATSPHRARVMTGRDAQTWAPGCRRGWQVGQYSWLCRGYMSLYLFESFIYMSVIYATYKSHTPDKGSEWEEMLLHEACRIRYPCFIA